MYRRITKTVRDKGKLINADEVLEFVTDPDIDWYASPFIYGEDAIEYFEEHNRSIKGYKGKVFTKMLYWDLDYKEDFEEVRKCALNLLEILDDLKLLDCTEIFFSGNKGVHIMTHVTNELTPEEVSKISFRLAQEAKIPSKLPKKIFDTTVYNVNRIFRIEGTKHQDSGLYKIPLDIGELEELGEAEIRKLAEAPRDVTFKIDPVEIDDIVKKYETKEELLIHKDEPTKVIDMNQYRDHLGFNPMDCPPNKRRCMYILENGRFGAGERENATIRLAAYCKGQGLDKEATSDVLRHALEKRKQVYPDSNPWKEEDISRNVDQVFSDGWNGGTYSCKTDDFLASKCDLGNGPCYKDNQQSARINVMTINGLIDNYVKYGNEAMIEYPKTGMKWLDEMVRLRPRNYSVFAGANGSGKTSIVIQICENLNKQKMPHAFFSLDMADSSLFEKLGARYTQYTQTQVERAFNIHFKNEPDNVKIREEIIKILQEKLPYTYFDFTSCVDADYMANVVYYLRDNLGVAIQLCIVDYAGRLAGEGDSDFANATQSALEANDVAKNTNAHFMYIAQIPRERGDHTKPLHSSRVAKSSGAWEENATIVFTCWRPFGDGLADDLDNYMHIYIAKNRSGALGEHVYKWHGKSGSLSEISEREYQTYEQLCSSNEKPEPPNQFNSGNAFDNPDRYETIEEDDNGEEFQNNPRRGNSGRRY